MNAISGTAWPGGFRANAVIRLRQNEPVRAQGVGFDGDEVVLEAVRNPPRTGELRPIAALLPEVLARYGVAESKPAEDKLSATFLA